MKKLLLMFMAAIVLVPAVADAGSSWTYRYSTSRHHIRVTCPETGSEQCVYEVWNRPGNIGQGKADLTIRSGMHILSANGNSTYRFVTGDVVIELFDELRSDTDDCLDVYVRGNRKSHYRLMTDKK